MVGFSNGDSWCWPFQKWLQKQRRKFQVTLLDPVGQNVQWNILPCNEAAKHRMPNAMKMMMNYLNVEWRTTIFKLRQRIRIILFPPPGGDPFLFSSDSPPAHSRSDQAEQRGIFSCTASSPHSLASLPNRRSLTRWLWLYLTKQMCHCDIMWRQAEITLLPLTSSSWTWHLTVKRSLNENIIIAYLEGNNLSLSQSWQAKK